MSYFLHKMTHLRRSRNILVQLVVLTFVLVLCASGVGASANSSPRKLSHDELRSAFSLKERFKLALALNTEVPSRQKRFIYFRFKLPFRSFMEIKWAINWVVPSEVKYFTRLQVALPITRLLPNYLVDDEYLPPFATLFGTAAREDSAVHDFYDYETEEESPETRSGSEESSYESYDYEVDEGERDAGYRENKPEKQEAGIRKNEAENEETKSKDTENVAQNQDDEAKYQKTKLMDKNHMTENKDNTEESQGTKSKTSKPVAKNKVREARNQKIEFKSKEETLISNKEQISAKSKENTAEERDKVSRRKKRSLHVTDRTDAYDAIEDILKQNGLPGRACLLRTICEVSSAPLHYGLIGDFLNLLLTPSVASLSASREDLADLKHYLHAEAAGREGGECHSEFKACPSSVFDLLPLIKHKILDFPAP